MRKSRLFQEDHIHDHIHDNHIIYTTQIKTPSHQPHQKNKMKHKKYGTTDEYGIEIFNNGLIDQSNTSGKKNGQWHNEYLWRLCWFVWRNRIESSPPTQSYQEINKTKSSRIFWPLNHMGDIYIQKEIYSKRIPSSICNEFFP